MYVYSSRSPGTDHIRSDGYLLGLVDIVLVAITTKAVVCGRTQKTDVLVVSVPALFAFMQLRTSMPGAPVQFGESSQSPSDTAVAS